MSAGWMAVGAGIVVAIVMLTRAWLRRHRDFDLGTVSHQWIAEQRLGQGHDPQR